MRYSKIVATLALLLFVKASNAAPPVIWGSPYPVVLGTGGIRMQNSDAATDCNAAAAGGFRYNAGSFQSCNGTAWATLGTGSGTVTTVAMTVPTFLSVAGSPVTTSGTLAVTLSGTALPILNGGTGNTAGTVALDRVTSATANATLANANFAQLWNFNSLTSETAFKVNSTSSNAYVMVYAAGKTTNSTVIIDNTTQTSGKGLTVNMDNSSNTGAGIDIGQGTTSGGSGMTVRLTGNGGDNKGITITHDAVGGSGHGVNVVMTGGSGSHVAYNGTINSTGAYFIDGAIAANGGMHDIVRLKNVENASNGNGTQLKFAANITGTGLVDASGIGGLITDITQTAYKGAIVLYTANNAAIAERMRIDNKGHVIMSGTAPTITAACGTSPSVAGTDVAGRITVGTGGTDTTCVLTFANTFGTAPACTVGDETTSLLLRGVATTATLTVSAATPLGAGDTIVYHCLGY